jgi:hypothetical protein
MFDRFLVGAIIVLIVCGLIFYLASKSNSAPQFNSPPIKYSELIGKAGHIYEIDDKRFWNGKAVEWYEETGGSYSVKWPVTIPDNMAGEKFNVCLNFQLFSCGYSLSILKDGKVINSVEPEHYEGIQNFEWTVKFEKAGKYEVELKQESDAWVMINAATVIYVEPKVER